MIEYLALVIGVVFAGLGGELFVRGAVGLGRWARISPGIVGVTIAAFATSSPEFSVAVNSALAGSPQISLGDSLGSNVVNVALILGIALLISSIISPRESIKRDFPVALVIPFLTAGLFLDGVLSRIDGVIMLCAFFVWLVFIIIDVKKRRNSLHVEIVDKKQRFLIILYCVTGLLLLVVAGKFIVIGAKSIAMSLGICEFIIGAVIVAVGTSIPELATTIIAKLRGHDEIGLGNIIGSSIFNGSFIVSVAAIIHPIVVPISSVAIPLIFGVICLIACYPARSGLISRARGFLLLGIYLTYILFVIRV